MLRGIAKRTRRGKENAPAKAAGDVPGAENLGSQRFDEAPPDGPAGPAALKDGGVPESLAAKIGEVSGDMLSSRRLVADLARAAHDEVGDHVFLDDWSFAFNASRPLQLTGRVFNNASGFEDGDLLEYTSQVTHVFGRVATTKSGTSYVLGTPAPGFELLRKCLWLASRAGAPAGDDGGGVPAFDLENPLHGVRLGDVVPCAPVRLPKVKGWSHQSSVALLHEWRPERTAAGFVGCSGTVFNCPGAYDGARGHATASVVACAGRLLTTLEGAQYFLGRRHGADADELAAGDGELAPAERAALGLEKDQEENDLLSV